MRNIHIISKGGYMVRLLLYFLLLFLVSLDVHGSQINSMSIGLEPIVISARSLKLNPGQELSSRLYFDFDFDFIQDAIYTRINISSLSDQSQHRQVELNYEMGIYLLDLEIYYRHHSGHLLDDVYKNSNFSLENIIGLRYYFIKDKRK